MTETKLACGIYTVLSSLYAVRNWKIDFVQQIHIRQARNWMAAIGHAIHEVVNLHRCRCGPTNNGEIDQPLLALLVRKSASRIQDRKKGRRER